MIRKIEIQNVQSHKNTVLELSPGINAIVGSSNNGKSAVLRALYWVRYNRPLGTDTLLSHWAVDKKGNQKEPMLVTVENEIGTVTRCRTKDENQYIVNNEELNVVKTDVPEQVERLLRLNDTNIQRQQDAPFLLSLSNGQVAQYFNKTVRLDIIDKVLSNAESKRRKAVNEIEQCDELLNTLKVKKEKYDWLDSAEKLLVKYENITNKVNQNKDRIELLKRQVHDYENHEQQNKKFNFVVKVKDIISKIEKLQQNKNEILDTLEKFKADIVVFENCRKNIYPSFKQQEELISDICAVDVISIRKKKDKLNEEIETFKYCEYSMNDNKEKIKMLERQLPEVCPLCGAVMKNGVCYEDK